MLELFSNIFNILNEAYNQYVSYIYLYTPFTLISIWRWGWWVFKKVRGILYKPYTNEYTAKVSVVIPVYKEDPTRFKTTLTSILDNNPYEVICVIDVSDKENIEYAQSLKDPRVIVIPTTEKGKRNALAKGIKISKGEIAALVDSDVIWTKDTLKNSIKPFVDPTIAGVCTRQNAINRGNAYAIITDMFWDARNYDDLPAMSVGKALSCLSGRTAFWRIDFLRDSLDEFLNEYIFGVKKESGEDKCLTRLAQRKGYKVYYQSTAQIYSYGVEDLRTFIKQRIRWSRNTFNSDLKSMMEGWVFKKPFLTLVMIDRFVSMFTIFTSPSILILALLLEHLELAYTVLGIILIGRTLKHIQHLRHKPSDILYVPLYAFFGLLIGLIKLYALVTIKEQKSIRGENKVAVWKRYLGISLTSLVFVIYIMLLLILKGYLSI